MDLPVTGEDAVRGLVETTQQTAAIHLTYSDRSGQEQSPLWGSVLSNLILGTYAQTPVRVTLPMESRQTERLVRTGLFFALAQREADTTVEPDPGSVTLFPATETVLGPWKGAWDPEGSAPNAHQGPRQGKNASAVVVGDSVSFKNPQRFVLAEKLTAELEPHTEKALLSLLRGATGSLTPQALSLCMRMQVLTRELIQNVADHPFKTLALADTQRAVVPLDRRKSYVQLFTTTGSGDRHYIHVVCADWGHGIPRTLRYKLAAQHPGLSEESDNILLTKLLTNALPLLAAGAGFGYEFIVKELASLGAANTLLEVVTSEDTSTGAVLARMEAGGTDMQLTTLPWLPLQGTIAHIRLPVHRIRGNGENTALVGAGRSVRA